MPKTFALHLRRLETVVSTAGKRPANVLERRQAIPPDDDMQGVLQWIGEAEQIQRRWARNTLALFAAVAVPVFFAFKLGLLSY